MRRKGSFTLWETLKDLGWFPLVLMSLGGLSTIDILESAVFRGLNLATPFQIVLNGYRRITTLLGAIVEPVVQLLINWIHAHWNLTLHLHQHWRALFVLLTVLVVGVARYRIADVKEAEVWQRDEKNLLAILVPTVVLGLTAFGAAVAGGLVSSRGGWLIQGALAALPVQIFAIGWGSLIVVEALVFRGRRYWRPRYKLQPQIAGLAAWQSFRDALGGMTIASFLGVAVAALAFLMGASLSIIPSIADGAGILTLLIFVALFGGGCIWQGVDNSERLTTRLGISVVGGFVAAMLVLISSWAVAQIEWHASAASLEGH